MAATQEFDKPFMQPMYVDLLEDANAKPQPIPLGFRLGIHYLNDHLDKLRSIGVNHIALNFRFTTMNLDDTLERIAKHVFPEFHSTEKLEHHA